MNKRILRTVNGEIVSAALRISNRNADPDPGEKDEITYKNI
jgi:hypothetical protein